MAPLHMIAQKYMVLKKNIYYYNISNMYVTGENTYRVACNSKCRKVSKLFGENKTATEKINLSG